MGVTEGWVDGIEKEELTGTWLVPGQVVEAPVSETRHGVPSGLRLAGDHLPQGRSGPAECPSLELGSPLRAESSPLVPHTANSWEENGGFGPRTTRN